MYLARLRLNTSRPAVLWASNPYRVHQRLKMACGNDVRLLFRIEDTREGAQVLVQSQTDGDWSGVFADFPVLRCAPEHKQVNLRVQPNHRYRFRLLANPTVKRSVPADVAGPADGANAKKRLGLIREQDQLAWLTRKLEAAGAELLHASVSSRGLVKSNKNPAKDEHAQTHVAVLFEGILLARDVATLCAAVEAGIGSAKGYGFGLLSLAPV